MDENEEQENAQTKEGEIRSSNQQMESPELEITYIQQQPINKEEELVIQQDMEAEYNSLQGSDVDMDKTVIKNAKISTCPTLIEEIMSRITCVPERKLPIPIENKKRKTPTQIFTKIPKLLGNKKLKKPKIDEEPQIILELNPFASTGMAYHPETGDIIHDHTIFRQPIIWESRLKELPEILHNFKIKDSKLKPKLLSLTFALGDSDSTLICLPLPENISRDEKTKEGGEMLGSSLTINNNKNN